MAFDACIPSQLSDFFFFLNTAENNQACLNFKIQYQLINLFLLVACY